ncbi:MAG TPA: ATP-binding protein, partial [Acidobacteriota bacterium]|nr:ATP-binding protein [Acidobacteriota bacterium]
GIGMDAHHLPRIFERLYRVDKSRSQETGGTGLGLAIVKHLVHANQGDISVESTPNEGTSFHIKLLCPPKA